MKRAPHTAADNENGTENLDDVLKIRVSKRTGNFLRDTASKRGEGVKVSDLAREAIASFIEKIKRATQQVENDAQAKGEREVREAGGKE